jgi:predicted transcriptional regulator of viral defense system
MGRSQAMDAGFDKLQEFLLAMTPGDELSVGDAHQISGLDDRTCEAVLAALMRAGLMLRLQQGAYKRVRLAEGAQEAGKSPFSSV